MAMRKIVRFLVSDRMHKQIREAAFELNISLGELIRLCINNRLKDFKLENKMMERRMERYYRLRPDARPKGKVPDEE